MCKLATYNCRDETSKELPFRSKSLWFTSIISIFQHTCFTDFRTLTWFNWTTNQVNWNLRIFQQSIRFVRVAEFNLMDSSRGRSSPGCLLRVSCRILQICVWTLSLWILLKLCTIQNLKVMGGIYSMISPWLQHHMYLHIDTNVDMWILIRGMQNYFPKSWHMTYNEFGIPLVNTPRSALNHYMMVLCTLPARNLCDLWLTIRKTSEP